MSALSATHRIGLIAACIIILAASLVFFMNKNTSKSGATDTPNTASEDERSSATSSGGGGETAASRAASSTVRSGAIIKTSMGDIEVSFYGADAPNTVENFTKLAQSGFYTNTKFHRVIKNFMIQGGDPFSKDDTEIARWGTGGPGYTFEDEINTHKIVRGVLAMANAGPGTNGSQFFIVTAGATPWLDGRHTVFGKVVRGMDVVERIGNTSTDERDVPRVPVIIEQILLK